ncbi:centrosomal protein of 192 kDa isoform X1 [Scleropages formosus]|uniref:centrosomal protein of 192 kDa isoform X1 n=1 Tax=Scleropages formosus TaxID=113540 RepID=UPI0010FABA09|nr:centrosomal protein of 192 kDa isoform X1 [Scleropages formosus]XP_018618496.2 centrosomal protein of 192 kDa isoform X1 [Scleropages formosus]
MTESFRNIEDEPFPSFLSGSLGSSRVTLGNVTLASNLGIPVAASTVAKIRAGVDDRVSDIQASYLEDGQLSETNLQSSSNGKGLFALSFKDDLDDADDFIAAHRFSDMLVHVRLEEADSTAKDASSTQGLPVQPITPVRCSADHRDEISTGLITFSHLGSKELMIMKAANTLPTTLEEESDGADSDHFSGSLSSFLANEKLMSLDSMNSDGTDDDIDLHQDDELEQYFNKLVTPAMQRGRVEGQEIPTGEIIVTQEDNSCPRSAELENRYKFLEDYNQEDFQMPHVRMAATGMDSCPASDEDTGDELEETRRPSVTRTRFLLPSTSRQLVGESNHPSFRPGLEGGSSDDELPAAARNGPANTGIEFRHSAEGQVISSPVTGNGGGGGDGSSGSEEQGNDGGVSTIPLPSGSTLTPFDTVRGLGGMGVSNCTQEDDIPVSLTGLELDRASVLGHSEIEDRVGPVGTGEASSADVGPGVNRASSVNWSMTLDRQEALDAMDSTDMPTAADRLFDSVYLRNDHGQGAPPDVSSCGLLEGTQSSFHLSQVIPSCSMEEVAEAEAEDQGFHGCPSRDSALPEPSDTNSEMEAGVASLDAKYLSRSFHEEDCDDCRHHSTKDKGLHSQQGANSTHSVVYQNEEGKWVTDLAYYSSFEKEMEINFPDDVANQFQSEEFISGSNAFEKILEDQEEFEKEHQFMQEEQMVAQNSSLSFGDTSWRLPNSHILMRASQVSSDFEHGNQSYLRLSLGEFFQQRSEALGCLGSNEEDIRRPSFGYVITSPEKREPFPLIRPSDFSSCTSSLQSGTVHLSDADKTLNAEDLDQTSEKTEEMQKNGSLLSEAMGKKDEMDPKMQASENKMLPNLSLDSMNHSNLVLSISTIASAIANASVSADPAQLATMIMELSKRSKSSAQQAGVTSTMTARQTGSSQADQSAFLELQKNTSPKELSAFDIEKYLRKVELSGSDSEHSFSPYSFDHLCGPDASQKRSTPLQCGELPSEVSSQAKENCLNSSSTPVCKPSRTVAQSHSLPTDRRDACKSGIPRPRASCISSSAKMGRASGTVKPCGANMSSAVRLNTVLPQVSGSQKADNAISAPGPCFELSSPRDPTRGPQRSIALVTKPSARNPGSYLSTAEKHVDFDGHSPSSTESKAVTDGDGDSTPVLPATCVEETQCTFRPSTSPLTHSSPSQGFLPRTEGMPSSPTPGNGTTGRQLCDPLSPSSVCSSPSLSRLTYISINDTTCLPTPDKNKGNSSLALSTTIVRASPSPPVDQDVSVIPPRDILSQAKSLDTCSQVQNLDYQRGLDHDGIRSRSECHFHPTGQDQASDSGSNKRHSEPVVRHVTQGDSGYLSNFNLQQPFSVGQPSQQLPGAISTLPPSFSNPDLGYIPISSFKPQGTLLDQPPVVPALLAGHSVFNSQLAQQYLGNNHNLRPFHVGATTPGLCSMPTANPPLAGVQGPVSYSTPGLSAALLNQGPPHPLPLDSALGKPYGQHELGTLSIWTTGGLSEVQVSHVVVPEELKFPNACCVGIASQTTLSIFNPMERWVQVGITVSDLSIDGEKVDSLPYQWLIVKNKTIVGPKSTEEQKVLFVPPQAGVYRCIISVSSWPASAESSAAARAEVFARRVVLIAVAENPVIEVDVEGSDCLEFGDLPAGSAKALPLKLINRTHATVPIRLFISANAAAWRCFTFSKSSVAMPAEGILQTGSLTSLAATSVLNHVMHASYGDNSETFLVWVHFHAPQRYSPSSGDLGPAEEYCARVDIELDGPGSSQVIRSVPLRARSGTARVHAPKDMQIIYFMAPLGKSSMQTLPLKNAGNINVHLKLRSTDSDGCFTVKPEELILCVGEERGIDVSYHAQGTRKFRETMLTILVLPSGPQYEVMLKGEMAGEDLSKRVSPVKVTPITSMKASEVPPILSNKQFVAWGGVTLGQAVQQKLVLRNNSPSSVQHLRLLIRGQDQDCFQLQSTFGPEERLTRHREISMKPKEDVAVHLLFAPTRVACMLAKLELKQSGVCSSQPGVKFTIPLSGYGGTSNIILEDVRKLSDNYVVTLGGVAAGRVSKVCLVMRNTGSRAAFIKAVAYADLHTRTRMDSSVISLSPLQFVLKERSQEVVTLLLRATRREQGLCLSNSTLLATVCFFCGDEVSRQQFRSLLHSKPEAGRKLLSDNSLLKDVNFNEQFLGEEQVQEAYDLPRRPSDAQLFYSSMNKVVLSVLGTVETSDSGESDCVESSRPSPCRGSESDSGFGNSDRHISNISLDVLPVKGPQGPALASKEHTEPPGSWNVHPEHVVLTAPTISSTTDTRHVRIHNHSLRELRFELSWPAHCLTVTPQHGTIEPESHLQILISPNPSLATKTSMLPWTGQVYVQCDNQQKFIKVQIRQDVALDVSTGASSPIPLSALPAQAGTPIAPSSGEHPETPSRAHTEIKNRTVVFPGTLSGETSESFLEVENGGSEVRWYLSSFAPPYVKGVDSSGDVYRATYTVFRCSRVSGFLAVKEKMKIPITFLPRDGGDYAQFWDLECHPVAEPQQKSRVRFQLSGTGIKAGAATSQTVINSALVQTEAVGKARKKSEAPVIRTGQEEAQRRGVYAPQELYTFPTTRVGESCTLKTNVRNSSFNTYELKFISPREPFHIKHSKYSLRSQHYINLPVQFRPTAPGKFSGLLLIQTGTSGSLTIHLMGEAVP